MNNSGVVNIYKEKGYTSSDVVSVVRKACGLKAGHTGTLDPQAVGVLPVCIGKATKIADYISGVKRYRAELKLGVTTDTDDLTGRILTENPVNVSLDLLKKTALVFLGESLQTPPMYSAVKIGGKKLYELARAGKTAERVPRTVTISHINIVGFNTMSNTAVIDVTCSKGTYVRSLCADIGRALNCGGCMGDLIRTQSGPFHISESITLDRFKEYITDNQLSNILTPIEDVLPYNTVDAPFSEKNRIINGNPIPVNICKKSESISEGDLVFLRLNGSSAGLYKRVGNVFKPRVMLTGNQI